LGDTAPEMSCLRWRNHKCSGIVSIRNPGSWRAATWGSEVRVSRAPDEELYVHKRGCYQLSSIRRPPHLNMHHAGVPAECSINYICNMLFINYSHLQAADDRRQAAAMSMANCGTKRKVGEETRAKSWGRAKKTRREQTGPDQTTMPTSWDFETSLAANAIPASKWRRQLSESKGVNKCGSEKGAAYGICSQQLCTFQRKFLRFSVLRGDPFFSSLSY